MKDMMKDLGARAFNYGYASPVLMVATYNDDGNVNVMNLHECTRTNAGHLALCIGKPKKTHENIEKRGAFTLTLATKEMMAEVDYMGTVSGYRVPDKFEKAGMKAVKSDLFLKKGYSVFLVDQPRRGAAGATEQIVNDPGDVANGKFKVGEQAWYTHFRIGRVAPERYEGSQFPEGDEALEEFFCQMTPNTGNYDEPLFGKALSAVLKDVQTMTGRKSIYVTHSQGGRVGWATDTDNMAAIIAVEPGFAPEIGSDTYKKFVAAKVPMLFLFGDYIENGPDDIQSTGFWKMVLQQCRDFAKQYNADGGDATVIYLPEKQIHGNSHFMFQEKNNAEIADLVGEWLKKHNL